MPATLQCSVTNTVELFQVTLELPPPGHRDSCLLPYPWRENQRQGGIVNNTPPTLAVGVASNGDATYAHIPMVSRKPDPIPVLEEPPEAGEEVALALGTATPPSRDPPN